MIQPKKLLLASAVVFALASASQAMAQQRTFDVPAQPAVTGVKVLAVVLQSDLHLRPTHVDPAVVGRHRNPDLQSGTGSPAEMIRNRARDSIGDWARGSA